MIWTSGLILPRIVMIGILLKTMLALARMHRVIGLIRQQTWEQMLPTHILDV